MRKRDREGQHTINSAPEMQRAQLDAEIGGEDCQV
jgi:hypothetical protein